MPNLTDSFFDAINGIARRQVEAAAMDLTVDAEIVKVVNIDVGEYKVQYQGNIFSAYATDPTTVYKNGERVYVLVPQGDFSRKKMIMGRSAYQNNLTYGDLQSMTNYYIDKGPNWVGENQWYKMGAYEFGICACPSSLRTKLPISGVPASYYTYGFFREGFETKQDQVKYFAHPMNNDELAQSDHDLYQYSKHCNYIKIQAEFKTNFSSVHNKGEYGLKVKVLVENPKHVPEDDPAYIPGEPEYRIDEYLLGFSSFNGSPYAFAVEALQRAYFQVTPGTIRGLMGVELWQDGTMIEDHTYGPDKNGNLVEGPGIFDEDNIIVSNIDIRFCEKINMTDTLYYPWIETPLGDQVYAPKDGRAGRNTVTLIPHLQYGYDDIAMDESVEIMWFIEKADITAGSVKENEVDEHGLTWFDKGGVGWYPIYKIIEEDSVWSQGGTKQNYDLSEDKKTLLVPLDQVPFEWNYKAVFIYRDISKDDKPMVAKVEAIQKIVRQDSKYKLELVEETSEDGRTRMLHIIDLNNDSRYANDGKVFPREWFGTWWLKLQDGSYTLISDPIVAGPFAINQWLANDVATFYVQCYDPYEINPSGDGKTFTQQTEVALLCKVIMTPDDDDLRITWVGRDTFNYDALGTVKAWVATDDNTLHPQVDWLEGRGIDYRITILGPDGKPLKTISEYNRQSGLDSNGGLTLSSSMMSNMWVDAKNTIHFKVKEQYDPDLTDNTFILEMELTDGRILTAHKEVMFIKDGDHGTIGSDWVAPIYPCNPGKFRSGYGDNVESRYLERIERACPLIVHWENGKWVQNDDCSLYLRPFVKKNGKSVESGVGSEALDPFEGYFYKAFWDVRMPDTISIKEAKYASFLRLYHAEPDGRAGTIFTRDSSSFKDTGGQSLGMMSGDTKTGTLDIPTEAAFGSKVNPNESEESAKGLVAFTVYPQQQYLEATGDDQKENYGAVEVRFKDIEHETTPGAHPTLEEMLYRFIVKCQVDVYKGSYDLQTHRISVEGNPELVASIVSYYPIDVLFDRDDMARSTGEAKMQFDINMMALTTTWPQWVQYNATGYDPANLTKELQFMWDGKNCLAYNLTPLTQTIEQTKRENTDTAGNRIGTYRMVQQYRAKPHLNFQEGFHGVLRTFTVNDETPADVPVETPFGRGFYVRNQIMYLNAYGNVDINGWDGQGIDMNEEEGTIFAITIGAGYKNPNTNTFTGVLMGRDRSQRKEDYIALMQGLNKNDPNWTWTQQDLEAHPYMAGLFGYQDGVSSFAILENGTAFFGRADRGGRIIIDGSNATIYGGGNGFLGSPEIGDPMWNCMRLTLVDLTHRTSAATGRVEGYWDNSTENIPNTIPIKGVGKQQVTQGFNGAYFMDENITTDPFRGSQEYLRYEDLVENWDEIQKNIDASGDKIFTAESRDGKTYSSKNLPVWYKYLWRFAYVKPDGALPYWYGSEGNAEELYDKLIAFDPAIHDPFKGGRGAPSWAINYYDAPSLLTLMRTDEDQEAAIQLSGFAPSRASTTPAIEIGQHMHGLMPGLLPWVAYESIFQTLTIPGDRNFMVTYDGTLWAMNGVFMGAIIGSNIIGGRIQGAEMGIGHNELSDENVIYGIDAIDDWHSLWAPVEVPLPETDIGTPGNVASYTSPSGHITAKSIRLYGGTFDLGHFHIIGREWLAQKANKSLEAVDKLVAAYKDISFKTVDGRTIKVNAAKELGHLIQYAHSDFIGPVHMYTNVGIGPKRKPIIKKDDGTGQVTDTVELGTLAQTYGFVALGIPLDTTKSGGFDNDESAEYHGLLWKNFETIGQTAIQAKNQQAALSAVYSTRLAKYIEKVKEDNDIEVTSKLAEGQVVKAQNFFGKTVNGATTIEQSAFFGIDASSQSFPTYKIDAEEDEKSYSYMQGHMWPMFFRFGNVETNQEIKDGSDLIIHAYMTTMDAFATSALKFKRGDQAIAYKSDVGQNYFRAGPFGVESTVNWIRKNFQTQWSSELPSAISNHSKKDGEGGNYLGWMGMVNRSGGDDASDKRLQMAVGITSWYNAPIIFECDSEYCERVAGHSQQLITGYGKNIEEPWETWRQAENINEDERVGYGITLIQGGSRLNRKVSLPDAPQTGALNGIEWTTRKGFFQFCVQGDLPEDKEEGMNGNAMLTGTYPKPEMNKNHMQAGIGIDPRGHKSASGLRIWNGGPAKEWTSAETGKSGFDSFKEHNIHIVRHFKKIIELKCDDEGEKGYNPTPYFKWKNDPTAQDNYDVMKDMIVSERCATEIHISDGIAINGMTGVSLTMGHWAHHPLGYGEASIAFGMDWAGSRWRHNILVQALVDSKNNGINKDVPDNSYGFQAEYSAGSIFGRLINGQQGSGIFVCGDSKEKDPLKALVSVGIFDGWWNVKGMVVNGQEEEIDIGFIQNKTGIHLKEHDIFISAVNMHGSKGIKMTDTELRFQEYEPDFQHGIYARFG